MAERLEIVVTGRVQGVAFRWHAAQQACRRDLTGRVRNLSDGSVRIVAEGSRAALESFLGWVREGPPHAQVEQVATRWLPARGEFEDFRISG